MSTNTKTLADLEDDRLDAIRARCNAATKGPWCVSTARVEDVEEET